MSPPLLASLLLVPLLAGLLEARRRGAGPRALLLLKGGCSICFLVVGFSVPEADPHRAAWIRVALVCGFLGDLALVGEGKRALIGGLVPFLLAHLALMVALAPRIAADPRGLAVVPLPALAAFLTWRAIRPRLGSLAVPAGFYTAAVAGSATAALAVALAAPSAPGALLLGVAGAVFLVSDIAVARERFVSSSFVNRLWGLPCYYGAQLAWAWSIARTV